MVMDVVAADKTKMLEERKGGPSRAMLKSILLSILHVRTYGPQDMIS
jgi:hypothetical protein